MIASGDSLLDMTMPMGRRRGKRRTAVHRDRDEQPRGGIVRTRSAESALRRLSASTYSSPASYAQSPRLSDEGRNHPRRHRTLMSRDGTRRPVVRIHSPRPFPPYLSSIYRKPEKRVCARMITLFICRLRASDPAPIKPSAYPHRLRVGRWNCQIFLTQSPQVPRFVEYPNRILMMHSGSITLELPHVSAPKSCIYEALVHPYFLDFSKCQIRAGIFYRRIRSDARGGGLPNVVGVAFISSNLKVAVNRFGS